MTPSRLLAVLAAAAAAGVAAWAGWIEPRRLVTRRRAIRLSAWPPGLDRLRVAVIADLHAGKGHVDADRVRRVARRAARTRPHVAFLLGDFIDHAGAPVGPEALAEALRPLRPPLGALAVLGNHDWFAGGEAIRRELQRAGIRVLEDDAVALEARRVRFWVVGLADAQRRDPDIDAAFAAVPDGEPVLCLSHNPDLFPEIPRRALLTFAGHTHAGQIAVPKLRARVIPSRFGERYAEGLIRERGHGLLVHPGIGTSRWPIRMFAPPEVTLVELRAPRSGRFRRPGAPRLGRSRSRAASPAGPTP